MVQIIDVAGSNRHLRAKGVSLGHVILRGRDSKIIAARAVREDAAGIVELLISVNADGERQVLCPLIQNRCTSGRKYSVPFVDIDAFQRVAHG